MKAFIRPVVLGESSMRINLLHKALITLGYTILDEEVRSHTAGKSTLEQVRALQKKLNIKYDEQYVVDQATYEAMSELMIKEGYVSDPATFVVSGTVFNSDGEKVSYQPLVAVDVDLRGAAKYDTVKNEKELLEGGFEFLRSRKSDASGNYYIEFYEMQFQKAERKKADVVVYAINTDGEIIGRSKIVNSEAYSAQGIVNDLNVIITGKQKQTEYEILMGKLMPFLKESDVTLNELGNSSNQVRFTSNELDEKEERIRIAVNAELLRNVKLGADNHVNREVGAIVSSGERLDHQLLYGLGRAGVLLDWIILYKKNDAELKQAIEKSTTADIIRSYSEREIEDFLALLHAFASQYTLSHEDPNQKNSIEKLLAPALPKKEQQVAVLTAYRNFTNEAAATGETTDYSKFWKEYLPAQESFKSSPELIPALILSQQLMIISGNYLPLVNELQVNRKLTSITDLLSLSEEQWADVISKSGIPDPIEGNTDKDKIANYASQVQAFLEAAYPTQKIAVMLDRQQLPLRNAQVAKGISSFLARNKDFDIGKTPIHEFAEQLKTETGENFTEAKKELNRMQRVFQVSPSPKVMTVLMENNLNSAYTITSYSKKSFVKKYGTSIGDETKAEAVYQRAEHISALAAERAMKMYDLSHLAAPEYAYSEADRQQAIDLLQAQVSKRHNPNYSEIFGSPDICECDECKSVYGAAAYLVDLLRLLERSDVNADGKSPLDLFKLRRPDLLYLPLTCENTNILIPYVDLVNEVMEYYTVHGTMDNTATSSAAYSTSKTSSDELRANPQNFVVDAYKKLKDAVYPFSLPYHQPLDVIRTYSEHLKTERYEVMKGMQKDFSLAAVKAIESEALRISQEEYVVLTGKKWDGTADTRQLHEYFGFTNAADLEKMAGTGISDGIHEFLRRGGVSYTDLVDLVKTKFINPNQSLLDYLQELFINSSLDAATIYARLQQIKAGTLHAAADADIMAVLTPASIAAADFDSWVNQNFSDFNSVITLYQPASMCDLDTTYLRTIQNIYAAATTSGIQNSTWSKVHRFIRLWKKLGWTIHETDLMLSALGETDITDTTLSKFCHVFNLNKKLNLPLNKLPTLWGPIDTYGDKSLYKKLFLNRAVQRIDKAFEADEFGNYLTDATQVLRDTTLATPVDHIPALLAAFRMSEDDLTAILDVLRISDNAVIRPIDPKTDKLNIYYVSAIYRYTVLSKALKLKVSEFCLLVKLFNGDPFSLLTVPGPAVPPPAPFFSNISPSRTLDFVELILEVKKSGFKAELLQYIFTGGLPAESKLGLDKEKIKQTVRTIREGLVTIEQSYPLVPAVPLTTDLVGNYLLLSFSSEVVSQLTGIIASQQTFSVLTNAGLGIVIPGPLNAKYSYDNVSGAIKSSGIMPDADRLALKALVGGNEDLKVAVDALYTLTKTPAIGAPVFSITTDLNLAVVIPDSLSPKFTYTKGSGRLTCTGIMSDNERAELKLLPGTNASFNLAIDALYTAPEDFIRTNFSGVFAAANTVTPNSDFITLLNHPLQAVEKNIDEKLSFVYENYLPVLKQKLRESSTIQPIAALIGLSYEATQLLIKNSLQPLIESIATEGLSGEYFSDTTWTTSVLKRMDNQIDFDWGVGSPDSGAVVSVVPANNFSARWGSYFSPLSSGEYALVVDVKESDETFNLFLDDNLIVKKAAADAATSFEIVTQLNASKLHKLVIEYTETTGEAGITLSWKTKTSGIEIIPASVLFPASTIDDFITAAEVFHRAAKFITGFKLTETEVNHLIKYSADFGNINFSALTPTHWQRINDYVQLRNKIPQSQALLTDVFVAANIATPSPSIEDLISLLNLATAWDLVSLTGFVKNYFGLAINDFKNEVALVNIYKAISFAVKSGLSYQTIAQWAVPETDFDQLNATADLVKITVKAKYEAEDWMKLAGDLSDKLRENQKQALISYLLTVQALIDWGVQDADGLFEYFLIDVQMGACMDTSRIVQANGAVQMFVNRCFLNLESKRNAAGEHGVSPEAIDKDRWAWMEYYRVWEVNRKIFITPENWLEPEWRDDKSEFFKDLESELTQNDINDKTVETAFRNYLSKLNTVANLDICGMYQQSNGDGTMLMLHVFGRTHNAPYQFFYRTCSSTFKWSAWEKVQLDIRITEDGNSSGMQLMPIVWKGRLFAFWTEYVEKQEQLPALNGKNGEATFQEIGEGHSPSSVRTRKYYEVRLAWSEHLDGKWSSKQLTKEFIKSPYDAKVSDFLLQQSVQSDQSLVIWIQDQTRIFGNFSLTDIQSEVGAFTYSGSAGWHLTGYSDFFMKYGQNGDLDFNGLKYLKNSTAHKILFSTGIYNFENTLKYPFFFQSSNRTYFVRPYDIKIWDYFDKPVVLPPIIFKEIDEHYRIPHQLEVGPDDYFTGPESIMPGIKNAYGVSKTIGLEDGRGINFISQIDAPAKALTGNTITVRALPVNMMETAALNTEEKFAYSKLDGISYVDKSFAGKIDKSKFYGFGHFRWTKGLEFYTFYHPFSSQFVTNLNQFGIKGVMNSDTFLNALQQPFFHDYGAVFTSAYNPNFYQGIVKKSQPLDFYKPSQPYTYYKENICFDLYGANSCYNWELFFHVPLYIATRLSKNGRYEEALKWFHYIFDPTTDELQGPYPSETSRYWKVLPFKTTPAQTIEQWFASINGIDLDSNGENDVIQEWRDNPFKPFLVARNRPLAFMKNVVIKYVENLREWGDSLFRVFQREQVYEALQLYVMAGHILGPRPQYVPRRGEIKEESYDSLKTKWDDFSNALVELENIFPYSSSVPVSSGSGAPGLLGIGSALYFCIPSNEKLIEHWDTIADRLYKIRHCMDIDGVKRQLALFAPPIDPAMLINATAQGLSLGSILSDLSSPPPIYRFTYLIQKANEFCSEVKSLGSTLLSVLEKKDAEQLGRLRASHETIMLDLMTDVKERQVLDARAFREGLLKSRESAQIRLEHYNSLLSTTNIDVPALPTIDANVNSESQLPPDTRVNEVSIEVDTALVDDDGVKLISKEKAELDLNLASMILQQVATATEGIAGTMNFIPTFSAQFEPLGAGGTISFGGSNIAGGISGLAKIPQGVGILLSYMATQSAKIASYIRREQEWSLQANIAAKDIIQLDKQITSADIKIQIAEKELSNHKQQIENSKELEQFLRDKFTNQELYQWMKEQVFGVYKQSFNMAYDMAKKVEKCYQYELGIEPISFIQYGYWNNSMQGLCAGEQLQLALRQLEKSYIEENKRELELSKNVSIALSNPLALQELKSTGKCFFNVPEELFDLDYQGHYFRRIKSVSISIPCIAGPYTTINCTLRLVKNTIRINTAMNDSGTYEHNNDEGVWTEDDRFTESNVPVRAIATSTALRDSGMFELNFRDERYLPFEGAGAISNWKLELTQDVDLRLFDYATISDVIMHISYTAREDAGLFKDNAVAYLKDYISNAADLSVQPLMRMFSLKHEFPTEWNKFLYPTVVGSDQKLVVNFRRENFPFFAKERSVNLKKLQVVMKTNREGDYKMILTAKDHTDTVLISSEVAMPENTTFGNMQMVTLTGDSAATANINIEDIDIFKQLSLKFKFSSDADFHSIDTNPPEISDLFLVCHYNLGDL